MQCRQKVEAAPAFLDGILALLFHLFNRQINTEDAGFEHYNFPLGRLERHLNSEI